MESVLQLYQLAMLVLPVYGYVSLRKRIRYGELSKKRAALRYAGMVFAPMLAYAAVFLLAIGVETVLDVNLAREEIARSFSLAIALGLVVWLVSVTVFAVGMYFVKSAADGVPPVQ
jgi:uncharacterized membrane protein (DUF485 family)